MSLSAASRPAVREPARRWRFSIKPWRKIYIINLSAYTYICNLSIWKSTYVKYVYSWHRLEASSARARAALAFLNQAL